MGEPIEALANNLLEVLQQAIGMGLVKTAGEVRKFLNVDAGMSNFGGTTATKMDGFLASGGLGHGRELGMGLTDTLGLAAAFGAMGARTGQFDARFMGQISQTVPKMRDTWMQALRGDYSEENRAVITAPSQLGYGSVDAMVKALDSGADGIVNFFARVGKLAAKDWKLVLEGFHFGEQGGAVAAEIGGAPEKARSFLARARELAKQKESADYLSERWAAWTTGLSFMIKQIEAGFHAIEAELGRVDGFSRDQS